MKVMIFASISFGLAIEDALRWFDQNRSRLPAMGRAARKQAEEYTWERYRRSVTEATAGFV